MRNVILVGCGKRKHATPRRAECLYTGPLFRDRCAYAEARLSTHAWLILSAHYGVLSRHVTIAPYDLTLARMSRSDRAAWGLGAALQLLDAIPYIRERTFEIHAGAAYADALCPALDDLGVRWTTPLRGMMIGEQRGWYRAQREGHDDADRLHQ